MFWRGDFHWGDSKNFSPVAGFGADVGSKLLVESTPNLGSLEHIESGALQRVTSLKLFFFLPKSPPPQKKKMCGQILVEKIPLPKLNVVLVSIINSLNVYFKGNFFACGGLKSLGGTGGNPPPSPRKKKPYHRVPPQEKHHGYFLQRSHKYESAKICPKCP